MAEPTPEQEALLAPIAEIQERIDHHTEERDRLLIERAELFRQVKEADPKLQLAHLGDRAGISVPAVIQQISKAKERLAATAGAQS